MAKAEGPPRVADYEIEDVGAIKALARGDASPEQQRRAMNWIINKAAMTYQDTYAPPDSDFFQGRRSVGLQIVKLVNMPVDALNVLRGTHGRSSGSEQPK
jgi:hypothetical protein